MISTLVKFSSQKISKQPVTTYCNSALKSLLSTYQINISNWKGTGAGARHEDTILLRC